MSDCQKVHITVSTDSMSVIWTKRFHSKFCGVFALAIWSLWYIVAQPHKPGAICCLSFNLF